MTISILGCGWYGLALAKKLLQNGYAVKGSTTSTGKLDHIRNQGIQAYQIDFDTEKEIYNPDFFDCEILFIAIPPKRKSGEASLFAGKIEAICDAATKGSVKQVILISSTGVYANTSKELNELDLPDPDTDSGKALLEAEKIILTQKNFTTTIIRFGGLFGPDRNPGRFFAGKKMIPNGLAPVNMIHLDDCLGLSLAIIEKQAFGITYNACSPEHPNRADFYTDAAKKAGLALPEFKLELLDWKVINSINIPSFLAYIFLEKLKG